jgi:hypothetical protein
MYFYADVDGVRFRHLVLDADEPLQIPVVCLGHDADSEGQKYNSPGAIVQRDRLARETRRRTLTAR